MESEDRKLVLLAVAGDPVALDQLLYRNYDRTVQHVAFRLPVEERNALVAEDVTQEALFVAAREIQTFKPLPDGDGGFFRWLSKIAEHRMMDVLKIRRAKKRGGDRAQVRAEPDADGELVEFLSMLAVTTRTPSRSAARFEALQALHNALQSIEDDYRTAVRMRYIDALPMSEVAQKMGRSEGAVAMLCQRGLLRLRECLGDAANFLTRKG